MIHADTKVTDVIDNPLFAGYGRLIFPTAFGRPSASMTLDEVGSLLIYHNYVNTDTTIDVIREMEERCGFLLPLPEQEIHAGRKNLL